jgi:serine/threonine protein phosphatase PrpC
MRVEGIAFRTDRGRVKENNEDFYYIDRDNRFFIIADGIGGNIGGEIASRAAVNSVAELLHEKSGQGCRLDDEVILNSINETNRLIHERASRNLDLKGMATTLLLAVFFDDFVTISHVGDSRAYLVRGTGIRRLTTDHSVTEAMFDQGLITEEEMRSHHLRHLVTSSIGTNREVHVDIRHLPLKKGDQFLLCTDGLTEMMTDEEIASVFFQSRSAEGVCNTLVDHANNKGGFDNITVVVIKIQEMGS